MNKTFIIVTLCDIIQKLIKFFVVNFHFYERGIHKMNFKGRTIKVMRCELDITQKELSEKCDVAMSTISGLEKHNNMPTLKLLLKIRKALNVPLEYFFEKEEG